MAKKGKVVVPVDKVLRDLSPPSAEARPAIAKADSRGLCFRRGLPGTAPRLRLVPRCSHAHAVAEVGVVRPTRHDNTATTKWNKMNQNTVTDEIVAAIRCDLQRLSTPTTSSVREVRRQYSKGLVQESPATILAVTNALFCGGSWPERLIASELLVGRRDAIQRLNGALVERWGKGLADWGSVDMYGVTVAGVAWRERRIPDRQVMEWAWSSNRWRRRLALVATVPLNSRARGGSLDALRTLQICRTLVEDRDDMVVKALSWALRELAKRDPEGVLRFIREEDERIAPRVRREVQAKIETGRKLRRR
jgi:3-methyladenine DNA glycosylase AlkD